MARAPGKSIEQYEHRGAERVNNPPVGLVSLELNGVGARRRYEYDPHLGPQLVWVGKAEGASFEVDTVSLHVHERIEPKTIIEAVRNRKGSHQACLVSFFSSPREKRPYREAIGFCRLGCRRRASHWRQLVGDELSAGERRTLPFEDGFI